MCPCTGRRRATGGPLVRAQGAHCNTAAHMPKAKPMKCQWRGASGGRALPREAALGQRASCPLRQRRDRRRWRTGGPRAGGRAGARPSRWRHSHWLSRLRSGPATNGKAIASPSAKRGAVLQCAPRARTQGSALAKHSVKRFQRRAGHGHGERKDCASTDLSSPKAVHWQSTRPSASKDAPATGAVGER